MMHQSVCIINLILKDKICLFLKKCANMPFPIKRLWHTSLEHLFRIMTDMYCNQCVSWLTKIPGFIYSSHCSIHQAINIYHILTQFHISSQQVSQTRRILPSARDGQDIRKCSLYSEPSKPSPSKQQFTPWSWTLCVCTGTLSFIFVTLPEDQKISKNSPPSSTAQITGSLSHN